MSAGNPFSAIHSLNMRLRKSLREIAETGNKGNFVFACELVGIEKDTANELFNAYTA